MLGRGVATIGRGMVAAVGRAPRGGGGRRRGVFVAGFAQTGGDFLDDAEFEEGA